MSEPTMPAVRVHSYGGPEVLQIETITVPQPGSGEVLVRVGASGVLPADAKRRQGFFRDYGTQPFPYIPGTAFAGIIAAVGPHVSVWQRGQRVLGRSPNGTAAEYVTAPLETLARLPPEMTFDEGATISGGATMAWQLVFEGSEIQPRQRVLVHGAAGGTGVYALQLLRELGAHIIATAGRDNVDFVRSLGADVVVDYTAHRFEEAAQNVDLVIDLVGGETLQRSMQIVRRGGTLLSIVQPPPQDVAAARGIRALHFGRPTDRALLEATVGAFASGRLRPVVGARFPLAQVREAHALVDTGHGRGRVVLQVSR